MTAAATRAAAGKPRPAGKPQPAMCVVTVALGIRYAMPMADGLAFMRAISSAVEVDSDWRHGECCEKYQVIRPAKADLRMIHPDQLQPVATNPTTGPDQP